MSKDKPLINLFDEFKITEDAEEGKWFEDTPIEGMNVKLRSSNSKVYQKEMAKARKGFRSNASEAAMVKKTIKTLVPCIVDWAGCTLDGKTQAECNVENKTKALGIKRFRDAISEIVFSDDLFDEEPVE